MISRSFAYLLAIVIIACLQQSEAFAATPTFTTIVVDDMHCGACAKKIAGKLYGVPGVLEVRADVKKNTAYVAPQKQKSLSPKKLWEAVEAAGFKPVKLHGPAGNFTSKPKS
jgi:copper chaperone CopZ